MELWRLHVEWRRKVHEVMGKLKDATEEVIRTAPVNSRIRKLARVELKTLQRLMECEERAGEEGVDAEGGGSDIRVMGCRATGRQRGSGQQHCRAGKTYSRWTVASPEHSRGNRGSRQGVSHGHQQDARRGSR